MHSSHTTEERAEYWKMKKKRKRNEGSTTWAQLWASVKADLVGVAQEYRDSKRTENIKKNKLFQAQAKKRREDKTRHGNPRWLNHCNA